MVRSGCRRVRKLRNLGQGRVAGGIKWDIVNCQNVCLGHMDWDGLGLGTERVLGQLSHT